MARPPKPAIVLAVENKSHRTKAEMAVRKDAEASLASGVALREWKSVKQIPRAHSEFLRVNKLLKKLEKNDDLFEGVVNRYCLLVAECEQFEEKRERFYKNLDDLQENTPHDQRDVSYFKTVAQMQAQIISCDKQVMSKRKMLFDIEKENIMTVAAVLRSIPKKPEEKKGDDPMAKLLSGKRA